MINYRFLKSAAYLFLLALAPTYKAKATDSGTQKAELGLYGRVFNITKLSGESNFMDTGRAAVNAWNDSHTNKADGYLNGTVIREFRSYTWIQHDGYRSGNRLPHPRNKSRT